MAMNRTEIVPRLVGLLSLSVVLCSPWTGQAQDKPGWTTLMMLDTYTASSTLEGDDFFSGELSRHTAANMNDGNPSTCWAEGAKGGGVGERIYIAVSGRPTALSLVNGYAKTPALFAKNGRVRQFTVSLLHAFHLSGEVTEVATIHHVVASPAGGVLDIKDTMERQSYPLSFNWTAVESDADKARTRFVADFAAEIARSREHDPGPGYSQSLILRLEIAKAVPGAKFEDTCVSELAVQ